MLVLNRKDGESIYIYPHDDLDPEMCAPQIFPDRAVALV